MTVCIAAIAKAPNHGESPFLVTMSDTMISGSIISSDQAALKMEPFHKEWVAMISGDDITQCLPIIEKAKEYFKNRANTLQVARFAFKKAFQQHLKEMREDAVLGGYGMSMEDFLKSGRRKFTEKIFESLNHQMEQIKPGCEFIVHGFDSSGEPHIFHVGGVGNDHVYDKPGFCTIGSGCYAADGMLHALGQSIALHLPQTIFNVCAAKFMAEKASGVGNHSYLYVRKFGSKFFSHGYGMVDEIRKAWERSGAPRLPMGIVERIAGYGLNVN